MIKKFKFLPSIVALLLCLTATAFGQETTGTIEGTITDPTGAAVPGVTVTVTSRGTTEGARQDATIGFTRTVTADDSGFFRVLQVPPGFYAVTTSAASGFSASTNPNVEVVLGKATPVNFQLQTGNVSETVTVTSDAIAIDTTDNKIQTNITAQVAELLPKGTNFTSLLQVAPSVRNEPLAGGFQVDGASGSENTFIIDGQEVTNFRTGSLNGNNNIPFQFVQEVQIKSSGFEAEFGGASGGVINVVTKGGSNEFHGEFGMTFRPAVFQANTRPTLRLFRVAEVRNAQGVVTTPFFQRAEYINDPRDRATDFFPTANFSGPIAKDRLWFFLSYTPQYYNAVQDINYISSDPRGRVARFTETYRASTRNEYAFSRLDASITDKLRLAGTFTWNPQINNGLLPAATQQTGSPSSASFGGSLGTLTGPDLLSRQGGRVNSNNFTGKMDWTPTSKLVFSARGGRSFLNEKGLSYLVPQVTRFLCTVGAPIGGCATGFQNVNNNNGVLFDVSIRKTFDVDTSYLVNNFGGRHQFKGGYQYNAISNDVATGYVQTGIVQLLYGTPINQLVGDNSLVPTPGNLGSGRIQRFGTVGAASSKSQTFFIQDQWQPINRLTFNIGARFEKEDVPSFAPGLPGISFGLGDKIAPRLGFAYDVTGDGKTKVFGFYGQFYDRFKYELPRGSFGGDFFRDDYFEILPNLPLFSSYTKEAILGNRPDVPGGNCPPGGIVGGTGLSRCQLDFRIPSNDPSIPLEEGGGIDPNIKAFRQSELTFGVERDLGGGYLFSGRYTHKKIDRTIEDIGFFNDQGSELYIIGNPGFGASVDVISGFGFPPTPKAQRDYDALELRFDKRFTRKYYFNASYTLSRLYGNYPGLASSDEAGRNSPNVNRLFDLPFIAFNADGTPNNGRLPTDRPHAFKFYGAYTLDWAEAFGFGAGNSTEISGFTQIASGTPITSRYIFEGVTSTILNGRGDLGRTEKFTQSDLALRHKYRFGSNERFTMVFDLDVLNLFNEANVLSVGQLVNARIDYAAFVPGDSATEIVQNFFDGNVRNIVNSQLTADPTTLDATYGLPNSFQGPRSVRFGFRLLF